MAKVCKTRFTFETLEFRRCLSGLGVNAIDTPVSVFSGEIAAFETNEELGGDYFGETGQISGLDENWKTVYFKREFSDPVVVLSPLSSFDATPATVRVRNVTETSFEARVQAWGYLDDAHGLEEVSYLAMERGGYETLDGVRFVADSVNAAADWQSATFASVFSQPPVILPQIASNNDAATNSPKIKDVSSSSFDIQLQAELQPATSPGVETVFYVAIQSGVNSAGIETQLLSETMDHLFGQVSFVNTYSAPTFFASAQSDFESDPGTLRSQRNSKFDSLGPAGIAIRFQEEDSRNASAAVSDPSLRRHLPEDLGILVLEAETSLQGFPISAGVLRTALPARSQQGYGAVDVEDLKWGPGLEPASTVFDGSFYATGWEAATLQDAIAGGDYLSFQIDTAANYAVSLSSLGLALFSDGGEREFSVFSNVTGFQPGNEIATVGPTTFYQSPEIDLSTLSSLQNLQGALELRVYGFGHTETNDAAGLATQNSEELTLTAEVVTVPKPSFAISAPNVTATEGTDSHVVFDITLDDNFYEPVQVNLDLVENTATGEVDYGGFIEYSLDGGSSWFAGTAFTLPENRDRFLARVQLLNDSDFEKTETFDLCVRLLGPTIDASLAPVAANVLDDDRRIVVTVTGDGTAVSEYGVSDEIAVSLSDAPASDVEVLLAIDTVGEVQLSHSALIFTPANWSVPQPVSLTGLPDFISDGDTISKLTLTVGPDSASEFGGLPPTEISVVNSDLIAARVLDERIFYNNSGFDQDPGSVPTTMLRLLPRQLRHLHPSSAKQPFDRAKRLRSRITRVTLKASMV